MDKIEKLQRFRDRVHNTNKLDHDFAKLVGIELYDFIQEEETLKTEFDRRLNYLKHLSKDKNFNLLQDSLFDAVQEILKLTSLKEVQLKQEEIKPKGQRWANYFKTKKGKGRDEDIWLTLPEIYQMAKDKKNYYRLGDGGGHHRFHEEVSRNISVMSVMDQYTINIEKLFNVAFFDKYTNDEVGKKNLDRLYETYNTNFYELDNLMRCMPVKLHMTNFEQFLLDCVRFHQRKGYEFFYSPSLKDNDGQWYKKAKTNTIFVIDDLIEFLKSHPENLYSKLNIREPINLKIGITIKGNQVSKGDRKYKLNPTDEKIVYFLYTKARNNPEECFSGEILAKHLQLKVGNIKNRISVTNKGIRNLITTGKTNVGDLIKSKLNRGYYLDIEYLK